MAVSWLVLVAFAAGIGNGSGWAQDSPNHPSNQVYRQQIHIAVGDSFDHFVTAQETFWRIANRDTLVMLVDSTLRVVRIALDGQRTTSWGRAGAKVVIPHNRRPGDTLVTTVRFHGVPNEHNWFALPRDAIDAAEVVLTVEVPAQARPVTDGVLERIDTLAYGRTNWQFRFLTPIALHTLRLSVPRPKAKTP